MIVLQGMGFHLNTNNKPQYSISRLWNENTSDTINPQWNCFTTFEREGASANRICFNQLYIEGHLILDQFQRGIATQQQLERFEKILTLRGNAECRWNELSHSEKKALLERRNELIRWFQGGLHFWHRHFMVHEYQFTHFQPKQK